MDDSHSRDHVEVRPETRLFREVALTESAQASKLKWRTFKVAVSALTGFIDIFLCCLILARTGPIAASVWGAFSAGIAAVIYLTYSIASDSMAADCRSSGEGPDLADRLDRFTRDLEEAEDGDIDPWPIRWFWNIILTLGWVCFNIGVLVIGYLRTCVTVVVFATFVDDVWPWPVVGVVFVAISIHFTISYFITDPWAERQGLEA